MISLFLSNETMNRLKNFRKQLSGSDDYRKMVPVHDIVHDGYDAYQKNRDMYADELIHLRSKGVEEVRKWSFQQTAYNHSGREALQFFRSMTGLTDDSAMTLLMDCLAFENGSLSEEYFLKFKETDVMKELNERTIEMNKKLDRIIEIWMNMEEKESEWND